MLIDKVNAAVNQVSREVGRVYDAANREIFWSYFFLSCSLLFVVGIINEEEEMEGRRLVGQNKWAAAQCEISTPPFQSMLLSISLFFSFSSLFLSIVLSILYLFSPFFLLSLPLPLFRPLSFPVLSFLPLSLIYIFYFSLSFFQSI